MKSSWHWTPPSACLVSVCIKLPDGGVRAPIIGVRELTFIPRMKPKKIAANPTLVDCYIQEHEARYFRCRAVSQRRAERFGFGPPRLQCAGQRVPYHRTNSC